MRVVHYLRHLAEVCKSAIAAECTAPERVQSTKEIWNWQRKTNEACIFYG